MRKERNESQEIFDCIKEHGPITAEEIAEQTGYILHLVDVVLPLLIEHGLVYQAGVSNSERGRGPLYQVTGQAERGMAKA